MNCRSFERQAADWLSGRLSPDRSEKMAAHQKACASCARIARTETQFRERWHEESAPPYTGDLWPRLARHIQAPEQGAIQTRKAGSRRPQWTAVTAIALAAIGACYWSRLPANRAASETTAAAYQDRPAPVKRVSSETATQNHAGVWSVLGDVAQTDPVVDDPTGTNMEDVWTYLKTDVK